MSDYSLAEDADIAAAVGRGADDALGALYDRFHRQCYAFALRILGSEPDAEEAVQETFVRAWRRAASYDRDRASVITWLLAITRNLCVDELRRRRRRWPEVHDLEGAQERPDPTRTDVEAERAILAEQVREALQALPGEQRSAIELVYFHGLTSQEVGQLLGVPSPTVRSRLRLGLRKLGSVLQAGGVITVD